MTRLTLLLAAMLILLGADRAHAQEGMDLEALEDVVGGAEPTTEDNEAPPPPTVDLPPLPPFAAPVTPVGPTVPVMPIEPGQSIPEQGPDDATQETGAAPEQEPEQTGAQEELADEPLPPPLREEDLDIDLDNPLARAEAIEPRGLGLAAAYWRPTVDLEGRVFTDHRFNLQDDFGGEDQGAVQEAQLVMNGRDARVTVSAWTMDISGSGSPQTRIKLRHDDDTDVYDGRRIYDPVDTVEMEGQLLNAQLKLNYHLWDGESFRLNAVFGANFLQMDDLTLNAPVRGSTTEGGAEYQMGGQTVWSEEYISPILGGRVELAVPSLDRLRVYGEYAGVFSPGAGVAATGSMLEAGIKAKLPAHLAIGVGYRAWELEAEDEEPEGAHDSTVQKQSLLRLEGGGALVWLRVIF